MGIRVEERAGQEIEEMTAGGGEGGHGWECRLEFVSKAVEIVDVRQRRKETQQLHFYRLQISQIHDSWDLFRRVDRQREEDEEPYQMPAIFRGYYILEIQNRKLRTCSFYRQDLENK